MRCASHSSSCGGIRRGRIRSTGVGTCWWRERGAKRSGRAAKKPRLSVHTLIDPNSPTRAESLRLCRDAGSPCAPGDNMSARRMLFVVSLAAGLVGCTDAMTTGVKRPTTARPGLVSTPIGGVASLAFNGKIAFTSDRAGNHEIYVMNVDGTAQTNITTDAADDHFPSWSPDGTKIAFTSSRSGDFEIY